MPNNNTGVYETVKKNGAKSYRVSLTFRGRHISLGSYNSFETAHGVYLEGRSIVSSLNKTLEDYTEDMLIPYGKFITLVNFRDNGIYFPTPIYLRKQYFEYYLSLGQVLKFDRDDLFFYAAHKIQQRGGYLFVSDYGSQYKLLGRYGIKPFAVYGRDYVMVNGDKNDYRYSNIRVINNYIGVRLESADSKTAGCYTARIHIRGNYLIGRYNSETEAAIAYNKAVDTLHAHGFTKAFLKNYITSMDSSAYRTAYDTVAISDKLSCLRPAN